MSCIYPGSFLTSWPDFCSVFQDIHTKCIMVVCWAFRKFRLAFHFCKAWWPFFFPPCHTHQVYDGYLFSIMGKNKEIKSDT